MLQINRQDNGPIAQGEPFYKRLPNNVVIFCSGCFLTYVLLHF